MDQIQKPKYKTVISLKSIFKNILPDLNALDYQMYFILLFIFIIAAYVLYRIISRRQKKNIITLIGLCESGKTHLFSQLCHHTDVLSVTSVRGNSAMYTLRNNSQVLIFDIPGHERIRYGAFNKIKSLTKGIVYVIDAATIQKEIRDVADFLYTVLCDATVQTGMPQVLIVCNKQDLPTAKGMNLIQTSLEREINVLRGTKASQLKSLGEGENNNTFLGLPGQDFEFTHLKPLKVSFVEAITREGKQLMDIENWLNSL